VTWQQMEGISKPYAPDLYKRMGPVYVNPSNEAELTR